MDLLSAELFQRYQEIIPDWEIFRETINKPLSVCIWPNLLKTSQADLYEKLSLRKLNIKKKDWLPDALILDPETEKGKYPEYLAGLYQIQEEVSMLPVIFMQPEPGEKILDLCAAPGNKTAQISVAMKNKGTLVANDKDFSRMRAIRNAIERLGLVNVATTSLDGIYFPGNNIFDKVLADVPCSCEGTSRKKQNGLIKEVKLEKIKAISEFQKLLLKRAIELCKPDGSIIYSTCTYSPEENEMVVNWALNFFGEEVLAVTPLDIPQMNYSKGLTSWQGNSFSPDLDKTIRIYPHQNDTGGFYIAKLRKKKATVNQKLELSESFSAKMQEEDGSDFLPFISDWFGFSPDVFSRYRFFSVNNREVFLTNNDFDTSILPNTDALGLKFTRKNMFTPKISNPAAMLFGSLATKNILEMNVEQTKLFISRNNFELAKEQENKRKHGYLLLSFQNTVFGIGFYHQDLATVESFFPKDLAQQKYLL